MKQFLWAAWEIIEVGLIAVISVLIVRNFLIQPFLVWGASMEPNFRSGDYLLIDEVTYRFRMPERGEVIVFRYPGDESTYYIKRVIGLPGEKVVIKNGQVTVIDEDNPRGFLIDEKYLTSAVRTTGDEEITLDSNHYFVLGDNRYNSFDSRSWGPLKTSEIVGIVRLRLWPVDRVMAFEAPKY